MSQQSECLDKVNRIGYHSVDLQSRPKLVGTRAMSHPSYQLLENIAFFPTKREKINRLSTLKVWRGENLLRVPTLLCGIVVHVTIYGSISTFLSFTDDIFLSSWHVENVLIWLVQQLFKVLTNYNMVVIHCFAQHSREHFPFSAMQI